MKYVLDTNIILLYFRDEVVQELIEKKYELLEGKNDLFISVVTLGEIRSIDRRNR